jgi:vacuolar protein sorting-associated protein 54
MEAHGMGLCSKLSQIVEAGMEMQLSRWEIKPPVPSPAFKSICKQLSKLHEAINDVLPPSQIDAIYSKIHASFRGRVHGQLVKAGLSNDGGPQHG